MAIVSVSGKIGSGKDTVANMLHYFFRYDKYDDWNVEFHPEDIYGCPGWETKKFAGKIKETVALWLGVTVEQLEDREFKETPLGEEWDKWAVYWKNPNIEGIPDAIFATKEEAVQHATYLGAHRQDFKHLDIVTRIQMTPRKMMQLLGTEAGREIIHPNIWVNSLFSDYKDKEIPTGIGKNFYVEYPKWIITDTRFPNEAKAVRERNGILIRVSRPYKSDMHGNHASETALDDWNDWDYIIHNNGSLDDLLHKVKEIYEHIK